MNGIVGHSDALVGLKLPLQLAAHFVRHNFNDQMGRFAVEPDEIRVSLFFLSRQHNAQLSYKECPRS